MRLETGVVSRGWNMWVRAAAICAALLCMIRASTAADTEQPDTRLQWWTNARFGMFIHFGLYAVPGGAWGDRTDHGEWIRTTAQIPLAEYEKLAAKFNPTGFNANTIVRAAKGAGMKYIVITTKHHDGFCLWDSKVTDWDVMSTPFKRDIMKEMAEACHREGIKICWYYSIMDWHHPDYVPRRDWEKDRPTQGADFDRYVTYMKAQLRELLTNYGEIGVLWFDGQWEHNWNDERGKDLYAYVRSLQPNIIINSRVGRSGGDFGMDGSNGMLGDYGTPEQTIPDRVITQVPWETCMTMNDHWGYNSKDKNFKTTQDLIRKLADIAGKGGNFLLNVGPTAEGQIPKESVERLAEIGRWMHDHGPSIHETSASPFTKLDWGTCTQRAGTDGGTRLYLHVFDWPKDGKLVVPGILNTPKAARVLSSHASETIPAVRREDAIEISVGGVERRSEDDTVIALDVEGTPDIAIPPTISGPGSIFVDGCQVTLHSDRKDVEIHYTVDGSEPSAGSPKGTSVDLKDSAVVSARCFRGGTAVSPTVKAEYKKVKPVGAWQGKAGEAGLNREYFEGKFKTVSDMTPGTLKSKDMVKGFDIKGNQSPSDWGMVFTGYVRVPVDGVYRFHVGSDDGSRLWIGDREVVENDGPHSYREKSGDIALAAGLHPIKLAYFENSGGFDLKVKWSGPGMEKRDIPAEALVRGR